jgi:hypothetical protein
MITLEANYSKKIGLPGYSSHQFSITLRSEIADLSKVQDESARLYQELQHAVDTSIQEVGYLPGENGNGNGKHTNGGNGHSNGNGHSANGNGSDKWNCSDKQRDLIIKIVDEHKLDKNDIEKLAQERFSKGVKALNKLEASGLIDELLEKHGGKQHNGRNRFQKAGGR